MDPIALYSASGSPKPKHCKGIKEPTAMTLATADKSGQPSARMVLLKGVDARGFVFYTNFESRKGADLKQNPHAALCLYWDAIGKQIRIEGKVEQVSDAEADAYFATRPRESQIGAWASKQSHPLARRGELVKAVAELTEKFEGKCAAPAFLGRLAGDSGGDGILAAG